MKERALRLKAIRKIITTNLVDSQEALLRLLLKEGFSITQATLSRDLKSLQVGKMSQGPSGYFYTTPSPAERQANEQAHIQDFLRGYVSIEFSANIGVIHTLTGHADSVALALDYLALESVLGTVAGDDTIVVVLAGSATAQLFMSELRQRIPDLET